MVLLESINPDVVTKVENLLPGTITIQVKDSVTSTNTVLKEYASRGLSNYILVAKEQIGGRGRYNRAFFSPKETGIYFSLLLDFNKDSSLLPLITPLCGVAVCEALEKFDLDSNIKWVNDVIYNDKKVCGILVETIMKETPAVIIGIGINLYKPTNGFPKDIPNAGYLLDYEKENFDVDLLNEVLTNLLHYYNNIEKKGFVKYYKDHCITVNKDIQLIDQAGNAKKCKAISLTDNLELVVKNDDGSTQTIRTGEASIIY